MIFQSLQCRRDVVLETGFKPAAVISFEVDFMKMDDDGTFHALNLNSQIAVPGQPISFDLNSLTFFNPHFGKAAYLNSQIAVLGQADLFRSA